MLDLIARTIRIPSISGTAAENDAQEFMAGRFAEAGLEVDHWGIDLAGLTARSDFPGMEVERSEAWGLVGRRPGTGDGATLMLNGHIDVVPIGDPDAWQLQPFAADVRGGHLHGRGACDMKAGLVAALWAAEAIRSAGVRLRGDLLVTSVQGEEDGGLGTFATLRPWMASRRVRHPRADIVGDDHRQLRRTDLPAPRTAASRHTLPRRTEGVSAIEMFWPLWQAIDRLERDRHRSVDPRMARWPLAHPISIGKVHAGDWPSSVPDLLVAEGRIGVAIGEPVADARRALERAVTEACDGDPGCAITRAEIEWWGGEFASGSLPADSDLATRVAGAHRLATGRPEAPDDYGAPYGSDLRSDGGRWHPHVAVRAG